MNGLQLKMKGAKLKVKKYLFLIYFFEGFDDDNLSDVTLDEYIEKEEIIEN